MTYSRGEALRLLQQHKRLVRCTPTTTWEFAKRYFQPANGGTKIRTVVINWLVKNELAKWIDKDTVEIV